MHLLSVIKNTVTNTFGTVSESGNTSFSSAITFVNLHRLRIIAYIVIFIMSGMIFFDYALLGATHKNNALYMRPILISMRFVFIFASLSFLMAVKIPENADKISKRHEKIVFGFILIYLVTLSVFTSMVQAIRDEISSYLMGMFLASAFIYLDRRQTGILFSAALAVMGTGTWIIQADKGVFVYNMINASIMTLFAWTTSQIIYASEKRDYLNQQLIKQQTAQLEESNEKLERLSYMDPLTNLPNRRYFDEYLDREWSKAQEDGRPISLILVDIDCFKELNDSFGHQVGDIYLKQIGSVLCTAVNNPSSLVARLGGDEFAIVLPDTCREDAGRLAQQILDGVRALDKYDSQPTGRTVTVSLGISSLSPSEDDFAVELFSNADHALYSAKKNGRNQCVCKESIEMYSSVDALV